MSILKNPLMYGGAAVVGLFLTSSLVLASPDQTPETKYSNFKLSTPAYVAQINGSGREDLLKRLGVEKKLAPVTQVAVSKTPAAEVPDKVKQAKTEAVKAKTGKVQVASRGGNPKPPADPSVVGYALSLQGIPYRFGGTTPAGFDCSGFTGYVFAKNGKSLPRTSYEQIKVGTAVSKSELQPGDLVFFSTYSSGASHVGIYVGGGNFVHASNSGTRTTSLNDSYYAGRFVGARRISK